MATDVSGDWYSTIALGNVVAIVQTNIKRMFAYSSISHMGFTYWDWLRHTAG